jgi:tetratricopeptide (TPR) repeat protein
MDAKRTLHSTTGFEKRKDTAAVASPRKLKGSRKAQRIAAAPLKAARAEIGPARNQLLWLGLVLVATFVAYLPVLRGGFTNYDDGLYIVANPMIRNLDWGHFKDLFSTIYRNQYDPIAMLIMAMEFKVFGASAMALKAVSLVLHLANTALVFLLIRHLFNRFDYAIITAVLFALNTQQVESVAWLAASTKIASYSLLFLSSLLAYIRYLKGKSRGWFGVSLFLFVLSCLCKEQAVALPATLLAIDYVYGRRLRDRVVLLEKAPFFIVSLIFAVVTLSLSGKMQSQEMVNYYSAGERFIFACFSVVSYVLKLVLPVNLSAFYTYPLKTAIPAYYYPTPIFGVLVLGALWFFWKKKQRIIVFGIVFFLANIFLPLMSQVLSVRDVMMADRYVYLPAIGFFLLVAYAVVELLKMNPRLRAAIWSGLLAYCLLLAVLTWQRTLIWENSITLFSDVIDKAQVQSGEKTSFLGLAYNNRGVARKQAGDRQGALADFTEVIHLNPRDARPWLNRGNLYFDAGQFDAALKDYNKSLELDSKNAEAYASRGAAYGAQNKFDLALSDLNRAIELDPMLADAIGNRALLYANTKRFAEELADIDRYLRLKPDDAEMINMRALALIELNRLPEAESELDRAIQLSPRTGTFYLNRSHLYQRTGRKTQALDDAQRAESLGVKVDPQYLNSLR